MKKTLMILAMGVLASAFLAGCSQPEEGDTGTGTGTGTTGTTTEPAGE